MKIILTTLFALMAQLLSAQTLEGPYSGELDVLGQMKLSITFRFANDSCTMDVLEQNVKALPVQVVSLKPDSLHLTVPMLGIDYKGKAENDTVKGNFTQNGLSLVLNLVKGEVAVVRPQTPQQPLPYGTQEVTFTNPADGAVLAGTLTFPFGYNSRKAKPPVVLMVSGSGQQDRDEELFSHKPFMVLADRLAKLGVASLRYDDRGTASSTGSLQNATTLTFAADAAAGVEFLRQTGKFSTIGVLGHSEGSLIAFMLKPDFIVSLAGSAVKGINVLLDQTNRQLQAYGQPTVSERELREQLSQNPVPWMDFFIDYDPADSIRQCTCPVMAINGSHDMQVDSQTNLAVMRLLLPKSPKHLIKEYEGLNHLFQHSQTGLPNEYGQIQETMSEEVMSDIAKWINGLKTDN